MDDFDFEPDRRTSIDLTLELEHQLDDAEDEEHAQPLSIPMHSASLDPDVLATIVIQQRTSLAELTQERDDLAAALSKAHIVQSELQSRTIDLQDCLDAEREKSTQMTAELTEAREKAVNDAESISMLRAKVEESRRGLMRLQSERDSRRASQFQPLQLDLGSSASSTSGTARTPGFSTFNKRASVVSINGASTPRTPTFFGAGHRRISSLSDPGVTPDSFDAQLSAGPVIVVDETPNEARSSSEQSHQGFPQPRSPVLPSSPPMAPLITPEELSGLRTEVECLRRELARTKEAKEASDICLRALRELIGADPDSTEAPDPEAAKALKGLSLPPLPTDAVDDEADEEDKPPVEAKKPSGWGIKLWGSSSAQPRKVSPSELPPVVGQSKSEPVPVALGDSKRSSSSSVPKADPVERPEFNRATSDSSITAPGAAPTKSVFRKFSLFSAAAPPPPPKDTLPRVSHEERIEAPHIDEPGAAQHIDEPHEESQVASDLSIAEGQPPEMDAMSGVSSLPEPPTPEDELQLQDVTFKASILHERPESERAAAAA